MCIRDRGKAALLAMGLFGLSALLFLPYTANYGAVEQIELYIADMTAEERAIVKAGCLINYNKFKAAAE